MKISVETLLKHNLDNNVISYWFYNNLNKIDFPEECEISVNEFTELYIIIEVIEAVNKLKIKSINANGYLYNIEYLNGKIYKLINEDTDIIKYDYNELGLCVKVGINRLSKIYVYNDENKVIKSTKLDNNIIENECVYEYNSNNLLIKRTIMSKTEIFIYDSANLLIKRELILNGKLYTVCYEYDENKEIVKIGDSLLGVFTTKSTIRIKDNKRNMYVLPFLTFN